MGDPILMQLRSALSEFSGLERKGDKEEEKEEEEEEEEVVVVLVVGREMC